MLIGSTASTTGSLAYLAGSHLWGDYTMNALVDWLNADSFALLVRYKDSENYISCSFSSYGYSVQMIEYKNGISRILGELSNPPSFVYEPWRDVNLGVWVSGNTIECIATDKSVLRRSLDTVPLAGGIGIKSWSKNLDYQLMRIKSITVKPLVL